MTHTQLFFTAFISAIVITAIFIGTVIASGQTFGGRCNTAYPKAVALDFERCVSGLMDGKKIWEVFPNQKANERIINEQEKRN